MDKIGILSCGVIQMLSIKVPYITIAYPSKYTSLFVFHSPVFRYERKHFVL